MREPENIARIAELSPDYLGFIFYPRSKRFVGIPPAKEIFSSIPESIQKAGVFVDNSVSEIITIAKQAGLQTVQLHGNETPDDCYVLKEKGFQVFKAFAVDTNFNFNKLEAYQHHCDYFLFDTKGHLPGGTGQKFDWQLLRQYQLNVPFFLSGGIGPTDAAAICKLEHPQLFGIDLNSGFEVSPALKDEKKLHDFISEIRLKTIQ